MLCRHLLGTLLFLFISSATVSAQHCDFTVTGKVMDDASKEPLSFVTVALQELGTGAITDEEGNYEIKNICHGDYHLIFSHIGCEPKKIHLHLFQDTTINVDLPHSAVSLEDVVVTGKNSQLAQANLSVNRQVIEDNAADNLSALLENETGVYILKNGSGISKPIVHGMYGNRLTILNNGIVQSGQQWGNDHSPEIDPFASDKITVVKGANAIEYGAGNLGSVILVAPKKISREPHLHGQVNYAFTTNGRGQTLNTRLEKYSPTIAWRFTGTLKNFGDMQTADYFLNNTGVREGNMALQLEKSWNEKLFLDFYLSSFNTTLGILRGSHVGNLTDLNLAFSQSEPFFTEPDFSSEIEAPKQRVNHHLAKLNAKYYFNEKQRLESTIAVQLNNRKEFDVRRSGRTERPALSLEQLTVNIATKYTQTFSNDWDMKLGLQVIYTDNTNVPETGILPLIPDYLSYQPGIFQSFEKSAGKLSIDFGWRHDFVYQDVVTISRTGPRTIERFENSFNNTGANFGLKYEFSKRHVLTFNSGFAMRNPAINELYSNGLHQGVSGIEEGLPTLKTEKALKHTLDYQWLPGPSFSFNSLLYSQSFDDYIFLNPQEETRLTIRGAFPVFKYEQTDAHIYGLDLSAQFLLNQSIQGLVKYSFLRGTDTSNDLPLVFMPPNSFSGSLTYRKSKAINISDQLKLEDLEFELNNRLVLRQGNLRANQDFVDAPEGYHLIGAKVSTNFLLPKLKFRFYIKGENLLNTRYRDYLNRQRYFADDLGRSITIGLNLKF